MDTKTLIETRSAENASARRGRKPSLCASKTIELAKAYLSEERPSMRDLGARFGISTSAAYRALQRAKKLPELQAGQ